jgi:hypothetical protein
MSTGAPSGTQQHDEAAASAVLSDTPAACVPSALAVTGSDSAAAHVAPKEPVEQVASDGTRISKIKVALVIGYNGSRFGGLQRNPGQFAIEDVLEDAVYVVP